MIKWLEMIGTGAFKGQRSRESCDTARKTYELKQGLCQEREGLSLEG